MKKKITVIFLFFLSIQCFSQIFEEFDQDIMLLTSLENLIIEDHSPEEIKLILKVCSTGTLLCQNNYKWNYSDMEKIMNFMFQEKQFINQYAYHWLGKAIGHDIGDSVRKRAKYLDTLDFWNLNKDRLNDLKEFAEEIDKNDSDFPELPFPFTRPSYEGGRLVFDFDSAGRVDGPYFSKYESNTSTDLEQVFTVCEMRKSTVGQSTFWRLIEPIEDMIGPSYSRDNENIKKRFQKWIVEKKEVITLEVLYDYWLEQIPSYDGRDNFLKYITSFFRQEHFAYSSMFIEGTQDQIYFKREVARYARIEYLVVVIQKEIDNNFNNLGEIDFMSYAYTRIKGESEKLYFIYYWEFFKDVFSVDRCN